MIELVQSQEVRSYELTYLLPTSLTSSEATQVHEAVKGMITKRGGEITAQEDWGKKELAYAIRHSSSDRREALYTHIVLSLPTNQAQDLEREILLQPHIMRHLLVIAEEAPIHSGESTVDAEDTEETEEAV